MNQRSIALFTLVTCGALSAQAGTHQSFSLNEEAVGIQERIAKFVGPDFYRPLTALDVMVAQSGKTKTGHSQGAALRFAIS